MFYTAIHPQEETLGFLSLLQWKSSSLSLVQIFCIDSENAQPMWMHMSDGIHLMKVKSFAPQVEMTTSQIFGALCLKIVSIKSHDVLPTNQSHQQDY